MSITREEWIEANKNYLVVQIRLLKEKLNLYQKSLSSDKGSVENSQALDRAEKEFEEMKKTPDVHTSFDSLVELFQLSPFEKDLLLLGVGVELDASIGKLVAQIHGDPARQIPTFSLALSLFPHGHWSALTSEGPLRYWQLIDLNKSEILTSSSFSVNERILHFLTGISTLDMRLSDLVDVLPVKDKLVPSYHKVADEIADYLSQTPESVVPPVIHMQGKSVEDQKAIVAHVFNRFRLSVFSLPVQLLPSGISELSNLILLWNREVMLNQHVLFLDGKQLQSLGQPTILYIQHFIEKIQGIVIISTEYTFTGFAKGIHSLEIDKPLKAEQEQLWKQGIGVASDELDGELRELVTQFNLDNHSILQLAGLTGTENQINGKKPSSKLEFKKKLWNVCCNYTRPNLLGLAQRIEPLAAMNELVLPEMQKNTLKEICIHVRQRQKVYYDWDFSSKSNRGLGISALFAGESGTGKTMAVEVIAHELQLDLFRIDLSQVVNKYIGETEKNLKKIFDAAEESGAILLFDEADALFGRRSEVKDSHDRYSNIEVSYLLQRMESYRGLAILTTNLKNAIDKAFVRRIRFIVHFPFPDANLRKEIWKRAFPKETPTKDLDHSKLASLSVTGGNIRNIALNATFAAAHKDQPVTMHDIHHAARNEYIKLEKQLSPSESII